MITWLGRICSSVLCLGVAACIAITPIESQPTEPEIGDLSILVTNFDGSIRLSGTLTIKAQDGPVVSTLPIDGAATATLRYGNYTVSFAGKMQLPISRRVVVNQRNVFVVLAPVMDELSTPPSAPELTMSLHVEPRTPCSPGAVLWAKLVGIYSDYSKEQRIDSQGFALFAPAPLGSYAVIVVEGSTVRGISSVKTWGPVTGIKLNLNPCK